MHSFGQAIPQTAKDKDADVTSFRRESIAANLGAILCYVMGLSLEILRNARDSDLRSWQGSPLVLVGG